MMNKQFAIFVLLFVSIFSCSKDNNTPEPVTTPTTTSNSGGGGGGGGGGTPADTNLFTTYSFSALLSCNQTPFAEVSSYLDDNNNTHIAWIKDDGNTRDLMYTVFDYSTRTFSTQTAISGNTNENLIAPEIITDDFNNPHIVYFKKRDNNSGINNGNYAVMYAYSSGGGFTSNQVSTNPTDPSTNDNNGLYNCDVNGRPSIYLDDGIIKISYQADANSGTSWNNYLITATQNGSSWNYAQILDIDAIYGNDSPSHGFSFPQYSTGGLYLGFIDISNYNPHFASENLSWSNTQIPGYSGVLGTNKHIQVEQDYLGTTHLSWFNTENNKFCHTTINNNQFTPIDEISINVSATGNLYPIAIDRAYGDVIMFYQDFTGNGHITFYDYVANDGTYIEKMIDETEIGRVYGRRSLFVNNEYLSLTTASESDGKIYVTVTN